MTGRRARRAGKANAGAAKTYRGGRRAVSNLRAERKQATRRRVLDAARDLFEAIGYEATTIRAIAQAAGVSVGSVFSSFRSKSEVLSEVMQARLGDLYADLARAAPHFRGSACDRCCSLFAVHYAFEFRRLRLFLAYVGAAFEWREAAVATVFGANPRLRGMVRDCLAVGIANGELRPDADLDLAADLLIGAYGWNYRLAAEGEVDAAQLIELFGRQAAVIFDGLRPQC